MTLKIWTKVLTTTAAPTRAKSSSVWSSRAVEKKELSDDSKSGLFRDCEHRQKAFIGWMKMCFPQLPLKFNRSLGSVPSELYNNSSQCVHWSMQKVKWNNILSVSPSFDDGYWIAFHTIFQHIWGNLLPCPLCLASGCLSFSEHASKITLV